VAEVEEEKSGLPERVALYVLQPFEVYYPGEVAGFTPTKAEKLRAAGVACLLEERDAPGRLLVSAEVSVTVEKPTEVKPVGLSLSALRKPKGV
jgi:hypothetical protein